MNHGSVFTGLGSFELAASWMGWKNVFHCEIDPFCRAVLNRHFPTAFSYDDINRTDFTIYRGKLDIFSGGFPCKQTSVAAAIHGKRKGLKGADSGLWYQQLRAIDESRPTWPVVENPSGVEEWEDTIQNGLEGLGYTVSRLEYEASYFGLPHKRKRYLYVGNSDGQRLEITGQTRSPTIEWAKRLTASGGNWLQYSPGDGRGIDGIPDRVDRIRAIGNSMPPIYALDAFRRINYTSSRNNDHQQLDQ